MGIRENFTMVFRGSIFIVLLGVWIVSVWSTEDQSSAELLEVGTQPIGCKFWRVRSITAASGDWWQVREIEFYKSKDGGGRKVAEKTAISSTYKRGGDTYKPNMAIDNNNETFWSARNGNKFEWIGVEFEEPQEIGSVKMQLVDWQFGHAMVIVEKSYDGNWWSRSTEVTDVKDWSTEMQLFPLIQMAMLPPSVFAFRSQVEPRFCIGVRTTSPPASAQGDPVEMGEFSRLEIQVCDDNRNTQYWALDGGARSMLRNAADQSYVVHVNGSSAQGTDLSVRQCIDGCSDGFEDDLWEYGDDGGGVLRNKNQPHLLAYPKGGEFKEGVQIIVQMCGAEGDVALSEDCDDENGARFELLPMFVLEEAVQAISCAPYSHSAVSPANATTRAEAQQICAQDSLCNAYNWADATATGNITDKVYSCTAMHEVHTGVTGWELGVRAGRLESDESLSILDYAQDMALHTDI